MRLLMVIIFLIGSVAESLRLYRVHVPHYKLANQRASLECDFDEGDTRLYAVKWYKDNEEFFTWIDRYKPPIRTHKVDGINVDIEESDKKAVVLKDLNLRSTGVYRCEVSTEAPHFFTVHGEGRMTVVHLPKEGPQIIGNLQDEYEAGDMLDLNCTSSKSFPPAKITWYINDLPVDIPYVISSPPVPADSERLLFPDDEEEYTLMISSTRLRIRLLPHHFGARGTAKVRCVASISTLFWQDGDEKIVGGSKKVQTSLAGANGGSVGVAAEPGNHYRFDSQHQQHSSSSSSVTSTNRGYSNYFNKYNANYTPPSPFTFNSTALVTVRGGSSSSILGYSNYNLLRVLAALSIHCTVLGRIMTL